MVYNSLKFQYLGGEVILLLIYLFKGMLLGIENVKVIYTQYVMTNKLQEFPVRRVCQCPLEGLFSRCRSFSMLGPNTNPTVQQFKSLMRKILVNNEVTNPMFANCSDQLDILFVSSRVKKNLPNPNSSTVNDQNISQSSAIAEQQPSSRSQQHQQQSSNDNTEDINQEFVGENIIENEAFDQLQTNLGIGIAFVAGQIEKDILKSPINCELCAQILIENEKITVEGFPASRHTMVPCISTYYVCETAHQILESQKLSIDFDYAKISNDVLAKIQMNSVFPHTDFSRHSTHKIAFVFYIVETYIRMWATFVARKVTIKNQMENIKKQEEKQNKIEHFRGVN